jgi:hypothetical protein
MSQPENARNQHDALQPEALAPEDDAEDNEPDREQRDSLPETDSDSAHRDAR